ncbi:MAG: hypothetical protein ACOCUS_00760 [Polyangiales bacterium]
MSCDCTQSHRELLAQWAALAVPVGPSQDLSRQVSVGTTAEDVELRRFRGHRIVIVATDKIGLIFGRHDETLPDPSLSSGDAITAEPGGDVRANTYVEHFVAAGRSDKVRVVAASASTDVDIYAVSRTPAWWREVLR